MRIGHGIQIPLRHPQLLRQVAAQGQCLEVCPTTYLKTGTLDEIHALKVVFDRCFEAGVDIAICTDMPDCTTCACPLSMKIYSPMT